MNSRRFKLPDNRGEVVFLPNTLDHMYRYAQTSAWAKEAGGQLFSPSPALSTVPITVATGPYPEDRRTRNSFWPSVQIATDDRYRHFENGLHVVGLWHTHPEANPTPSFTDKTTTRKHLYAQEGDMDAFLLAIVGNKGTPFNLAVWIASSNIAAPWSVLNEIMT